MKNSYDLDYLVEPRVDCVKYIKSYNENSFSKHLYDDMIIRGNLCPVLISILFNTNNIDASVECIKTYVKKAKNSERIQFCIKIDNDPVFLEKFLNKLKDISCNFVILSSPKGRGYIDLWQWINFLFKVSSRKASFVLNISDEMTINEKNWDISLEKYLKLEKDDIFRLRTSLYKNRNYNNLYECAYAPDTTAIYTRKYLNIQGDFSPCFGPDNGQQFVAYYLSKLNYPRHFQFSRDKVINDISFSGQGTNIGVKNNKLYERQLINYLLWCNMFKKKYQEKYFHRARKIQLSITKSYLSNAKTIHQEPASRYVVRVFDHDRDRISKVILSYKINTLKQILYNISKTDFYKHQTAYDMPKVIGLGVHICLKYFKRHPKTLFKKSEKRPSKFSALRKLWNFISSNHGILQKYNFILPIKILIIFLVFFDFKGFITFLIYFSMKIILSPIYFIKNPTLFIYKIDLFLKFYKTKSILITKNDHDQSKTIMIKGD